MFLIAVFPVFGTHPACRNGYTRPMVRECEPEAVLYSHMSGGFRLFGVVNTISMVTDGIAKVNVEIN